MASLAATGGEGVSAGLDGLVSLLLSAWVTTLNSCVYYNRRFDYASSSCEQLSKERGSRVGRTPLMASDAARRAGSSASQLNRSTHHCVSITSASCDRTKSSSEPQGELLT